MKTEKQMEKELQEKMKTWGWTKSQAKKIRVKIVGPKRKGGRK